MGDKAVGIDVEVYLISHQVKKRGTILACFPEQQQISIKVGEVRTSLNVSGAAAACPPAAHNQ
jgi:hypothetical protein